MEAKKERAKGEGTAEDEANDVERKPRETEAQAKRAFPNRGSEDERLARHRLARDLQIPADPSQSSCYESAPVPWRAPPFQSLLGLKKSVELSLQCFKNRNRSLSYKV